MKALKALVAVMGILIVLGLVLLGWGIYTKMQRPAADVTAGTVPVAPPLAGPATDARQPAPVVAPVPSQPFGTVTLAEPPGTEILAVDVAEGRILLRLSGGGKPDRVVVLHGTDGTRLGTIELSVQQ